MVERLGETFAQKRILILGYGREGQSSFRLISQLGGYACLDIADRSAQRPADLPASHGFFSGEGYMNSMDCYDLVFKSPGIVLPRAQAEYRCTIASQTDLFLQHYGAQVIGVTGTKGKSTVSSLLHHVLQQAGYESVLAGNIGIPIFDIIPQMHAQTRVVFELSCHQLEYCTHAPAIGVLLNIYEDHLDHYSSFEAYAESKRNLYRYQGAQDKLYCHPQFLPAPDTCAAQVISVDAQALPIASLAQVPGVQLRGAHNLLNCAFVYEVCRDLGVSDDCFLAALQSFQPLPHRLQFLGTCEGVDYYDDSISTTAESAISAVESIENAAILLLGGMDRGIDYQKLVDFLPHSGLKHVIFMYESGARMHAMLAQRAHPEVQAHVVADLESAVVAAKRLACRGEACVLSPASASYGVFQNFEERGKVFQKLVFG